MRRACSTVCWRIASACWRSARMAGPGILGARFGEKSRDLLVDEQPRAAGRHFALLPVLVDQLLQIVDGKQVNVFQLGDRRIDVARHRQVHHEDRPPAPRADGRLRRALGDERHRARGAADDDVGLGQFLVEILETDGIAP